MKEGLKIKYFEVVLPENWLDRINELTNDFSAIDPEVGHSFIRHIDPERPNEFIKVNVNKVFKDDVIVVKITYMLDEVIELLSVSDNWTLIEIPEVLPEDILKEMLEKTEE